MPQQSTPRPLATWSRARGVWETDNQNLCGHLVPSSGTWPISGSMRSGRVYAPLTSAPPTGASASSSPPGPPGPSPAEDGALHPLGSPALLNTPTASDGKRTTVSSNARDNHGATTLGEQVIALPTPTARDYKGVINPTVRTHADGSARLASEGTLPDAVLALLPTPTASEGGARGDLGPARGPALRDLAPAMLMPTPTTAPTTGNGHARDLGSEVRLLPTPAVNDMGAGKSVADWDAWTAKMKSAHGNGNGHGPSLAIEAARLAADAREIALPTPRAATARSSRAAMTAEHWSAPSLEQALEIAVGVLPREFESWDQVPGSSRPQVDPAAAADAPESESAGCGCAAWGRYAGAIHRWELVLRRAAPAPTELGTKDNPRLAAEAVEFMMGLPKGWVTAVPGITRAAQLKMLGNGVVPQQAILALDTLLRRAAATTATGRLRS